MKKQDKHYNRVNELINWLMIADRANLANSLEGWLGDYLIQEGVATNAEIKAVVTKLKSRSEYYSITRNDK